MNWQQKALAIQAVCRYGEFALRMRRMDDWYVAAMGVHRKEGGCLSGGLVIAKTPEEAVEQFWDWATDPKYYLVTTSKEGQRRAVKWNGFMWEDVNEEKA